MLAKLASLGISVPAGVVRVEAYGDSPELSASLLALIRSGRKRAGTSLLWAIEADGEELPVPGQIELVVDHRNEPALVCRITDVHVVPFHGVTAEYAAIEGEGDGSLDFWIEGHWAFFARECRRIGREPQASMPVVCSVFELLSVVPSGSSDPARVPPEGDGGFRQASTSKASAIRWLLDSDPSIRWQVLCDLTDAPADEVAVERARVATEGAGARLLALQAPDGRWGGAAWNRGWDSTMHVLMLLREMGLDPASDAARRAVGLVREHVTWRGCGPQETEDNPFFAGELEPCINGQVGAVGAYFGQDVRGLVERLLAEQLPDGGWNCEAPSGSTRSSFNTTICVLEALLEHERAVGGRAEVTRARLRGQEYLLERRLFRRRSTGEVIERDRKGHAAWTRFAFPTWWHYDVLRGLEYLRRAGAPPDERVAEAIDLVASKRDADGRWPLEARYPGKMPVETDEGEGRPSRWNTLRALRVLDWYSTGDQRPRGKP